MKLGVKFSLVAVDSLHAVALEVFHEFVVDKLYTFAQAIYVGLLVHCLEGTLKVVDKRHNVAHSLFGSILHNFHLLLESALAEVVELSHKEEIFLLLLLNLLLKLCHTLLKGRLGGGFGLLLGSDVVLSVFGHLDALLFSCVIFFSCHNHSFCYHN